MGWPRKPGRVRRTPELELLVCSDYSRDGKTLREIGRERGLGHTAVHSILVERGVQMRPVGNHRKLKVRRGPAYDSEVVARFRDNQPLATIARQMRTSRRLVMDVVADYGLVRQPLAQRNVPEETLLPDKAQA